ncbi:unnamed protein product [Rangifer tarandus platyrhynchus]|uniref:Uncharacterized protein n=2 Tax=Rangifer tarandus platyrhynchus TaxID=3082113 RepID=A0ABN8Y5I3_RANTA|nr:unnamed protein product [Rangifer tarandus platyrhynchus]CAI9692709.1 unnamed protein product [Rangifer tarandus platyrhynchus]
MEVFSPTEEVSVKHRGILGLELVMEEGEMHLLRSCVRPTFAFLISQERPLLAGYRGSQNGRAFTASRGKLATSGKQKPQKSAAALPSALSGNPLDELPSSGTLFQDLFAGKPEERCTEQWFGRADALYASERGRGETDTATQCAELSLKVSSEIADTQSAVPQSREGVTREGFLENVLVPYSFRKKLSLSRKKIFRCLEVKIQSHLFSPGEELVGRPFAVLHSSCYFERF